MTVTTRRASRLKKESGETSGEEPLADSPLPSQPPRIDVTTLFLSSSTVWAGEEKIMYGVADEMCYLSKMAIPAGYDEDDSKQSWAMNMSLLSSRTMVEDDLVFPPFPTDGSVTMAPDVLHSDAVFIKRPKLAAVALGWSSAANVPASFLREIGIMERLSRAPHPHIIRYLGCRVRRGRITGIVLENMPRTLGFYDSGASGVANLDKEVFLARLQEALDHLHGLGLAHNDLNPNNVTVRDGLPVLIDFDACAPLGEAIAAHGTPNWVDEENRSQWHFSNKENDNYGLRLMRERFYDQEKMTTEYIV